MFVLHPPTPVAGLPQTLCPAGDGHEWDVLQEGTTAALSATGAGAGLAALICLPLMLCLPAVFYGTKSLVKQHAPRQCGKCKMARSPARLSLLC